MRSNHLSLTVSLVVQQRLLRPDRSRCCGRIPTVLQVHEPLPAPASLVVSPRECLIHLHASWLVTLLTPDRVVIIQRCVSVRHDNHRSTLTCSECLVCILKRHSGAGWARTIDTSHRRPL